MTAFHDSILRKDRIQNTVGENWKERSLKREGAITEKNVSWIMPTSDQDETFGY